MNNKNAFDYVIVGAGSAGCVLANRLTEDPNLSVLLLEAGPADHAWAWQLHMPAALAYPLANNRYNWFYISEPEPFMDGRRMYCPRGRVLGGSSSINGMAYVRGHARDYDRWAQAGLRGWSYAEVLPYFKRAETRAHDYDQVILATSRWEGPWLARVLRRDAVHRLRRRCKQPVTVVPLG